MTDEQDDDALHQTDDVAPQVPSAPPPNQDKTDLIETWFAQHFHNASVAISTEVYNLIHAAKEELKRIL